MVVLAYWVSCWRSKEADGAPVKGFATLSCPGFSELSTMERVGKCEVELTFKFFKNTVSAVKINRLCMVAIYWANLGGDIINATVKLATLIVVIKIVVSRVEEEK